MHEAVDYQIIHYEIIFYICKIMQLSMSACAHDHTQHISGLEGLLDCTDVAMITYLGVVLECTVP